MLVYSLDGTNMGETCPYLVSRNSFSVSEIVLTLLMLTQF